MLLEKTGEDIVKLLYLHDRAIEAQWRSFDQKFMKGRTRWIAPDEYEAVSVEVGDATSAFACSGCTVLASCDKDDAPVNGLLKLAPSTRTHPELFLSFRGILLVKFGVIPSPKHANSRPH